MKKKPIKLVVVIVILGILGALASQSFYTLGNTQVAIVERFGKMLKVDSSAGLHNKIPFIDNVIIYNTNEILSIQYGYRVATKPTKEEGATYDEAPDEANVLTKGSYLINIGAVIQYKISDPAYYHYQVDDQEFTIRLAFESVLRSNVQNQLLDEALVNKDLIAKEIIPDLIAKLNNYKLGVTVVDVRLTDVLLPEKVQFAYDDVNIASNEKDANKSNAEKYANEKLPAARADAYKMIQGAMAYKAEKIAQAKGDTENFNQVYEKYVLAKDVTMERMYIETMEKVLSKSKNKYIIDSSNDSLVKYMKLGPGIE